MYQWETEKNIGCEKEEQNPQVMGNTTDKPDFVGIVGHGTGEVYISLPIYLGDRPGRRMYSELVGSLEGKRLAGMRDAISEANKHFCRTTLKSHSRESIKKSTLCENILLNWKCRRKWTFIVYHFKEMVLSLVSLRDSSSMTFLTPRPKHPGVMVLVLVHLLPSHC